MQSDDGIIEAGVEYSKQGDNWGLERMAGSKCQRRNIGPQFMGLH